MYAYDVRVRCTQTLHLLWVTSGFWLAPLISGKVLFITVTLDQIQGVGTHGKVISDRGEKVGGIGQIYLDDQTGEPK